MDLVIEPSACKLQKDEAGIETPATFKGKVTVKLPTMPESYMLKAKYGRQSLDAGKLEAEDKTMATLELVANVAQEIQASIVKVELEELGSKKKIASVEDLYSYEPAFPIIAEIAMKFITGFAEKK